MIRTSGGQVVGELLARSGVRFLFTLCGGHISPILVGAKAHDIRVVDVRDEANAVFAADAVARMTGTVGVAAVTAGPGVTNTITAVKNAQMAESPILIFGGAAATILKGRGSLQDIDQLSIVRPITKWATTVKTVPDLAPTVERALRVARQGVPGPVFVEIPIDLLYPEEIVREWYFKESGAGKGKGLGARALELYLRGHLYRQFHGPRIPRALALPGALKLPRLGKSRVADVAARLRNARRPVLVVGSQALVNHPEPARVAAAIESLGIPTFLGGMARGLLGRHSPHQLRHHRGKALKEADVVVILGFPFDFRLGYGRAINRKATLVAANLSESQLRKNRRPTIAVHSHPGEFLEALASAAGKLGPFAEWTETLQRREAERDAEIAAQGAAPSERINPITFFLHLEEKLADDSVLVVDGGDFVATGSYVVRPRRPLSWLDPGVFGTLGVGGGFALGASLCRPGSEVWLLYGDGSCAYSVAEFDTYVRHGLAPIAVVGTDASWGQIARDQVEILGDDVGTVLRRTDYQTVAAGYGGVGLLLDDPARIDATIDEAKARARAGKPVLINVHLDRSEFRKGSISM